MSNGYSSCPTGPIERCSAGTTSAASADTTDNELAEFETGRVMPLPAQEEEDEECNQDHSKGYPSAPAIPRRVASICDPIAVASSHC
jgi:hypothetical protein